jgi:hypothetical protein
MYRKESLKFYFTKKLSKKMRNAATIQENKVVLTFFKLKLYKVLKTYLSKYKKINYR